MAQYFYLLLIVLMGVGTSAQIGINNPNPDASAALDVTSIDKGLLPPRMSKTQRDAISKPAEGLLISCSDCEVAGLHQYINGSWQPLLPNSNNAGDYGTVVNPSTGKVWLDRNLGATQVATSSDDAASYGDLYQWGRGTEGHQVRTSLTTITQATDWLAGSGSWNGLFITTASTPNNWLSTAETHMWSGTAAENNPCPSGFRVPTNAEWEQERLTWSSNNATGAFASPLKLPATGGRGNGNGSIVAVGTSGRYWSSTVSSIYSRYLRFDSSTAFMNPTFRANGYAIRCLKD